MLEIHERQDTIGYENIVATILSENIHIVESKNGESTNGYGVYSVGENGLSIHDYESGEWDIIDGIIRTILFKGMLGGINRCEFQVRDVEKQQKLTKLGFINEESKTIEDINDFMSNCKKCKHSK
ncbi:MAG: hypothetical protein E7508_06845 [Ruminococcus sp.]|nr:hypothetical protein [Ruminococcus sp.]